MLEEQILSDFGQKLHQLRTELGLSQERLGELAQLDRTYVSSVERGQRNISLLNICRLASALECTPDRLLCNLRGPNE